MGERTETKNFAKCDRCARETEVERERGSGYTTTRNWARIQGQNWGGEAHFPSFGDGYRILLCDECANGLTMWMCNPDSYIIAKGTVGDVAALNVEAPPPLKLDEAGLLGISQGALEVLKHVKKGRRVTFGALGEFKIPGWFLITDWKGNTVQNIDAEIDELLKAGLVKVPGDKGDKSYVPAISAVNP